MAKRIFDTAGWIPVVGSPVTYRNYKNDPSNAMYTSQRKMQFYCALILLG